MRKRYSMIFFFLISISLALGGTGFAASPLTNGKWAAPESFTAGMYPGQEENRFSMAYSQVTLSLYVLDGGPDGSPLSGVAVTVYDAGGNRFERITNPNGLVVVRGDAGMWRFALVKDGYTPLNVNHNITANGRAFVFLESATVQPEQVSLTAYVHDGSLNGTQLSGVRVTGQDAGGNAFEGTTDSNGAVTIGGQPGLWQFQFTRDGYEALDLSYEVNETHEAVVYLTRSQAQPEQVSLTAYVHDGSLNGTQLSGVRVTGQDAGGNAFEGMTDSNGAVTIGGQPGLWQFQFTREGYETLDLSYEVNETHEAAAYLEKAYDEQEQNDGHVVTIPLASNGSTTRLTA
ncbi:MAG: Cna protein B-type domain protein [Methanosaeta sp. PtaU1.Bin060]|nr:MAG: Cna protein B-type domain protein [Methanosaeta sp. PtaU1.Bin060]